MKYYQDELIRFAGAIVAGGTMTADAGAYSVEVALEVYRNNYRGNLQDALAGAYPVTLRLVGDDFFRFMARQYIGLHPSASGNLHHYGDRLAEFLASFDAARSLAYLPDIARLEWACHQAFFATDEAPDFFENLARVPPERYADLILRSGSRLIRSDSPIVAIWRAHQTEDDFEIDTGSGAVIAQVYRLGDEVVVGELSEADAHWLECIQAGQTLGVATDATLSRYPGFDLQRAMLGVGLSGFAYGGRA